MKTTGISFKPKDAPPNKYADYCTLDEARERLDRYLNDEITIDISAPRISGKNKKKKIKKDNLNPTERILASIALIGERIISKYLKGQKPHPERMLLWDKSLMILEKLCESGKLNAGQEIVFTQNGYAFTCIHYHSDAVGNIVLPLDIPHIADNTQNDIPNFDMKRYETLTKKIARDNILGYELSKAFKSGKWNYVYILRCKDDTLYTGWTNDIKAREFTHNAGKGAKYTKSRLPVRLEYWEVFGTKSEALKREAQIKKYTRKQKLMLLEKNK